MKIKEMRAHYNRQSKIKMGPTMQKILLLLMGGVVLGLSGRPDTQFRFMRRMTKEWKAINQRALHNAIEKLYQSRMIDYKENSDKTTTIILTDRGKTRALQYNLENMCIKKPRTWDGFWRVVIFDVPEHFKKGRNALAGTLKRLGFYPIQKSVFLYPYECKDEIDFIVEIFDLRPYVRFLVVKEIDIDLDLKHRFKLL